MKDYCDLHENKTDEYGKEPDQYRVEGLWRNLVIGDDVGYKDI